MTPQSPSNPPAEVAARMEVAAPVGLLVKGARLLVTMTGEEIEGGWVAIRDGKVAATGVPGSEPEATRTLDASDCLVTPGLVNAHHHMYQNLTRCYRPAVNKEPEEWWPMCAELWKRIDEEASYVSTWVGLAELALGGCTTTSDHLYVHPRPRLVDAQIAAARELGFRFHPVRGAMDRGEEAGGALPAALVQDREVILEDCERLVGSYHDCAPDAMVQIALGPCTTFDSSLELFRASAELAERLDIRLHTHLAELISEEGNTLDTYGKRPLDLFEDVGWASSRAWVAHCIFVNEDEIDRLGRWGTGVAHCPSTNMLCCRGIAPIPELRAADVPVGLACDGSGYTDHGSLWLEARTALLLTKLRLGAPAMTARDVLEIATAGSAACLGRQGELGVLAPGACGDLVVWPLSGLAFAGAWSDPVEGWLRCGPVAARHTVVAGELVVEDGELTAGGLDDMLGQHARISRSWQLVADRP